MEDDSRIESTREPVPPPPFYTLEVVNPQHYALEGEQGRGGLGRVLRARDLRLDRMVAVKELLLQDAHARGRFLREVRITASLQHPGIVPIHEAGQWPSGEPFYAMKLVEGRTLRELIDGALTLEARLALLPHVVAVAEAVGYAHSKGIIHRDLKPANVIVGEFGETVVIDWGLAKDLHAIEPASDPAPYRNPAPETTRAGSVLGTPAYMSPEQARGETLDARSDVYALGAILYAVLSGKAPLVRSDSKEPLEDVAQRAPKPVFEWEPRVAADLNAIVVRAMARNPADRYVSAKSLADDLRRYQMGQLVKAHDYALSALVRRWIFLNRRVVTVSCLLLLGALSVSSYLLAQVRAERKNALAHEQALQLTRATALAKGQQAALFAAEREVEHDPTQAMRLLASVPPLPEMHDDRLRVALAAVRGGLPLWSRSVARGAGFSVTVDGTQLVVMFPQGVQFINSTTGVIDAGWPLAMDLSDEVLAAQTLPNGDTVGTFRSGSIVFVSQRTPPRVFNTSHGRPTDLAASPDGKYVAVGFEDGGIWIFDLSAGQPFTLMRKATINALIFDGDRLISVGQDGVGLVMSPPYKGNGGRRIVRINGSLTAIGRVGQDILCGTDGGAILRLGRETSSPELLYNLRDPVLQIVQGSSSEDAYIITTKFRVIALNVRTRQVLEVAEGDRMAVSRDLHWLFGGGTDGKLSIVDTNTAWRRTISVHRGGFRSVQALVDGRIATLGYEHSLRVWPRTLFPAATYHYTGFSAALDAAPGRGEFILESDSGEGLRCADGTCTPYHIRTRGRALSRLGASGAVSIVARPSGGEVEIFDSELRPLETWFVGAPLRDVRPRADRVAALTFDNRLYLYSAVTHAKTTIKACETMVGIRWVNDESLLVLCADGSTAGVDVSTGGVAASMTSTGHALPPRSVGLLPTGEPLVLYADGSLFSLRSNLPLWSSCVDVESRLFQMNDAPLYMSHCHHRIQIFSNERLVSPDLGEDSVYLDGTAENQFVAVGSPASLSIWAYGEGVVATIGSDRLIYDVQILATSPPSVVTLSGRESAQEWNRWDDTQKIPLDHDALASWIVRFGLRYQ